jgi:protocatechuate 3,4-dioxygenase beta subunit
LQEVAMFHHSPTPRRRLVIATAALIGAPTLLLHRARAQTPLRATPRQTEGPFYPVELPADRDHDLLANGPRNYTKGQATWLAGTVRDTRGAPLADAAVEIWQCDQDGHYHHPGDRGRADPAFQGFGSVVADEQGRYRFRTLRPAPYSGRTPHIHLKVKQGSRELLTTQVYVAGDPGNERDGLWRRLSAADRDALTVAFAPGSDGALAAQFAVVVEV